MMMKNTKRTILILCIMLFSAFSVLAETGNLKFVNVGYTGRINNVKGSVYIYGTSGSSYVIDKSDITKIDILGEGTVTFENCTVSGLITIKDSPDVSFKNCIISSEDTNEQSAITIQNMTGGSLSITGDKEGTGFTNPAAVTINGEGATINSLILEGENGLGTSDKYNAKKGIYEKAIKGINLNSCENIGNFSLGTSIYVQTLNLAYSNGYVTGTKITSDWNTWKIVGGGLNLKHTGLTQAVIINNQNISGIDISDNKGVTGLTINGSETFLKSVNASGCTIGYANITMAIGDSSSSLNLSSNILGTYNLTEGKWESKSENNMEFYKAPVSEAQPTDPVHGTQYFTYSNIVGPTKVTVNCPTCNGTGLVDTGETTPQTNVWYEYPDGVKLSTTINVYSNKPKGGEIEGNVYEQEDFLWVYVGNNLESGERYGDIYTGSQVKNSSGPVTWGNVVLLTETYKANNGTVIPNGSGLVSYKGEKKSEVIQVPIYDTCPDCEGDGHEDNIDCWTCTETIHTYTNPNNNLVINDHVIETRYSANVYKEQKEKDFTTEWNGISASVDLSSNNIVYKASISPSDLNGHWTNTIIVKAFGDGKSRVVAMASSANNGDDFYGNDWHLKFNVDDKEACSWGKTEKKTYNVTRTLSPTGTNIKFTLDRYRNRWPHWNDVQGLIMEIYPFG